MDLAFPGAQVINGRCTPSWNVYTPGECTSYPPSRSALTREREEDGARLEAGLVDVVDGGARASGLGFMRPSYFASCEPVIPGRAGDLWPRCVPPAPLILPFRPESNFHLSSALPLALTRRRFSAISPRRRTCYFVYIRATMPATIATNQFFSSPRTCHPTGLTARLTDRARYVSLRDSPSKTPFLSPCSDRALPFSASCAATRKRTVLRYCVLIVTLPIFPLIRRK